MVFDSVFMEAFEPIVGLEVHAQLLTRTKAFCSCPSSFGASPNTHVCPVCLGLPGALPFLNEDVVMMALRVALALGCTIHQHSTFSRKHYFYPDLPKGYQITQQNEPLATGGRLESLGNEGRFSVEIERLHIEEDAGKTVHLPDGELRVDFNRAGIGLVEIVTAPQLRSGEEAAWCLRRLRNVLMALEVCDGNMEEGSLRCDVNVSVRRRADGMTSERTEVKNVNSFRFVKRAVDYEWRRHVQLIEGGKRVERQTLGWDERAGVTFPQRSKEVSEDYRHMSEPDLMPLVLDLSLIEQVRGGLPELPGDRLERFLGQYGIPMPSAEVLSSHASLAEVFEQVVGAGVEPGVASNFIGNEVMRDVKFEGLACFIPVSAVQLADLLLLVSKGTISGTQAKEVYEQLKGTSQLPSSIVRERGLEVLSDEKQLRQVCEGVVSAHGNKVASYREGKKGLLGFFVGEVMKKTSGRADPRLVNGILRELLE